MRVNNPVVGSASALVTPFRDNKVDTQTYSNLIRRQIRFGMDACVPAGTTGESATLSHLEHMECVEVAVCTCSGSRTKVIAGSGSNSTKEAIDLARFSQKCGADAILCVAPYYNKPSQQGLYMHFKCIAESVDIPVVLYDVPSRTGVSIEPDTALRLFRDVRNIYAIKESCGSLSRLMCFSAKESDFMFLSGDDMLNLPVLSVGGAGVISVTGNLLPGEITELVRLVANGDRSGAIKLSDRLYDINHVLFCQSNPIPVKAAMHVAGLIPRLEYRSPLCAPSKECMDMIVKTLEGYEVKI